MTAPLPQRVLVIDDDPVMRELLHALLSAKGHTVTVAEDGDTALVQLGQGLFADVILTDIQLPGLSGAPLAQALHAVAPAALLLGMSGSLPEKTTRAAFHDFLLKPFTPEDFAASITRGKRQAHVSEPVDFSHWPALDETTYYRLAAALPVSQLGELYQLTLTDIDGRVERLREASMAHDLATWRHEAHALKGGCSMVGAAELAHLATLAETADASVFNAATAVTDFLYASERLRSILSARFS